MAEIYERRYTSPTASVAHLLSPFELSKFDHTPTALCGKWAWNASDWFGSGTQDEHDRAASLPTCKNCQKQVTS